MADGEGARVTREENGQDKNRGEIDRNGGKDGRRGGGIGRMKGRCAGEEGKMGRQLSACPYATPPSTKSVEFLNLVLPRNACPLGVENMGDWPLRSW